MSKRVVVLSQWKFMLVLFVSMSLSSVVALALSTTVMLDLVDDTKFAAALAGISWIVVWVIIVELAILACVFSVNVIRAHFMTLWDMLVNPRRRRVL